MAELKHVFASWQKLAGDDGEPWETEDDMMFLLDFLPPSGEGLEQICAGHAHGEAVLARLQRFFHDAAIDGDEGGSEFSQQKLPRKTDDEIRQLLLQHAANLREMAVQCSDNPDEDDIVQCIGNPPELTRVSCEDEIEEDPDLEILLSSDLPYLYEERVSQADPGDNPLWYLTEALYHSAWNHYAVANYVQWPIAQGKSTLSDPYLPAYELWLQNVVFRYTEDGRIAYAVEEE